jgi:hypothetical protein
MILVFLILGIGNIFIAGMCWGAIKYSEQVDIVTVPVKLYIATAVTFLIGTYVLIAMIGRACD